MHRLACVASIIAFAVCAVGCEYAPASRSKAIIDHVERLGKQANSVEYEEKVSLWGRSITVRMERE